MRSFKQGAFFGVGAEGEGMYLANSSGLSGLEEAQLIKSQWST